MACVRDAREGAKAVSTALVTQIEFQREESAMFSACYTGRWALLLGLLQMACV